MSAADVLRQFGNELYKSAFPIYRTLYHAWKKYSDRDERKLLARFISRGGIVVDAGANIGAYSQFLAGCVGPKGQVHSFEPDPKNFARLRDAMAEDANVQVNQLAVSDRTGESLLYVSETLNVDHRAYATAGDARQTLVIRSTALDDYFPPGTRIDLMKMDIQGYELHAMRGAERILRENPAITLMLEFWPYGLSEAGGSAEALVDFLHDCGFSLFTVGKDGLEECDSPPINPSDATDYRNLFARKNAAQIRRI